MTTFGDDAQTQEFFAGLLQQYNVYLAVRAGATQQATQPTQPIKAEYTTPLSAVAQLNLAAALATALNETSCMGGSSPSMSTEDLLPWQLPAKWVQYLEDHEAAMCAVTIPE